MPVMQNPLGPGYHWKNLPVDRNTCSVFGLDRACQTWQCQPGLRYVFSTRSVDRELSGAGITRVKVILGRL